MRLENLVASAEKRLEPIAARSGRVLYSGSHTLRPGPMYLLGLNPGGDPTTHNDTVGSSLREMLRRTENAYLDESWRNCAVGRSPLQLWVQWLLRQLGFQPRDICASNLIFTRSVSATDSGYPEVAELCWPVHEQIIAVVQPIFIVAFGNSSESPYRFLCQKLQGMQEQRIPSGHGSWDCTTFISPKGIRVFGLPHLSRYAVSNHPHVVAWVRETALRQGAQAEGPTSGSFAP
jgi:uracil-DNA glycosylase